VRWANGRGWFVGRGQKSDGGVMINLVSTLRSTARASGAVDPIGPAVPMLFARGPRTTSSCIRRIVALTRRTLAAAGAFPWSAEVVPTRDAISSSQVVQSRATHAANSCYGLSRFQST